jgi:hypothetical protein
MRVCEIKGISQTLGRGDLGLLSLLVAYSLCLPLASISCLLVSLFLK